jgi:hypothetical protein
MMPASVKFRSLFVTVYMERMVSFASHAYIYANEDTFRPKGSQTGRPVFTTPPFG